MPPTTVDSQTSTSCSLLMLVGSLRSAWQALGDARIGPAASETPGRRLRRSLFVVADMWAGEPFTPHNVRSIRPGDGLHPRYYGYLLGRPARADIARGTPLGWQHVG